MYYNLELLAITVSAVNWQPPVKGLCFYQLLNTPCTSPLHKLNTTMFSITNITGDRRHNLEIYSVAVVVRCPKWEKFLQGIALSSYKLNIVIYAHKYVLVIGHKIILILVSIFVKVGNLHVSTCILQIYFQIILQVASII